MGLVHHVYGIYEHIYRLALFTAMKQIMKRHITSVSVTDNSRNRIRVYRPVDLETRRYGAPNHGRKIGGKPPIRRLVPAALGAVCKHACGGSNCNAEAFQESCTVFLLNAWHAVLDVGMGDGWSLKGLPV